MAAYIILSLWDIYLSKNIFQPTGNILLSLMGHLVLENHSQPTVNLVDVGQQLVAASAVFA